MKKLVFLGRHHLYDKCLECLNTKYAITLYSYGYYKDKPVNGVNSRPAESTTFGLGWLLNNILKTQISVPVYIKRVSSILHEKNPDVVITLDFFNWSFIQVLRYKIKNPKVRIILLSETKKIPRNLFSKLAFIYFLSILKKKKNLVDKLIVPTDMGVSFYKKNLPEIRTVLVPAPIDTDVFKEVKNKQWLTNGELRIIMNARYIHYKRHEDLFLAVKKILSSGKKCSISLISRDDQGLNKIKQMVERYELEGVVFFISGCKSTEVPSLYHKHDVLVLPSQGEAIGMVVPEAMACGIPTITSDTVGANVYVKDGVTGWIYPTGDITELEKVLNRCYDLSELKRRGYEANRRVRQFCVNSTADILEEEVFQ